jgi:hypothetical protein
MALQKQESAFVLKVKGVNENVIDFSIDVEKYQTVMANSSNGQRITDNGKLPEIGKKY